MRIAVLLDNVVQFIYESEEMLDYGGIFTNVDITDYTGEVYDFYIYEPNTNTFIYGEDSNIKPVISDEQLVDSAKLQKQILVNTEYIILLGELGAV